MRVVVSILTLVFFGMGCASGRLADPNAQRRDSALPRQDINKPPRKDGGVKPRQDKSQPKKDRAAPPPDKAKPKPDKAKPKPDKALPKLDKGAPPPDKGQVKKDKGATCPKVIYSSKFEGNKGNFKSWGDWQWGVYAFKAGKNCDSTQAPPPKPHSGIKMWGTVLNDCHSPVGNATAACNNSSPQNNSILRLEIKVPVGCKKAFVEWWEYNDYFLNFDWAEVRIANKVIHQNCNSTTVPQKKWIKRVVDISQFMGKNIGLEFHFLASGVINYSGWYIDDVVIRVQ